MGEPEKLGSKLTGKLDKLFAGRKVDPDIEAGYRVIDPVPLAEWVAPDANCYSVFNVTDGDGGDKQTTSIPTTCLGVDSILDWGEQAACKRAKQIAIEVLGYSPHCTLHFTLADNHEFKQRERARKLLPETMSHFPQAVQSFGELEVTAWNTEAIERAKRYTQNARQMRCEGKGIGIRHSQVGCGKTALLTIAILEAARRYGFTAHYVFIHTLLDMQFGKERTRAIEACYAPDFLLMDDIDANSKPTSQGGTDGHPKRTPLLSITQERERRGLPILWTSNSASDEDMIDNLGERTFSRLKSHNYLLQFGVNAWDWRTIKRGAKL